MAVVSPPLVSLRLHPPGDYVSDRMREGGWYEGPVMEEAVRRLQGLPPGELVDVGAMIGTWSVYLAQHAPHRIIHAFEPSPANLPLLLHNTAPWPLVRVNPLALSDREQLVRLQLDPVNRGHSRVVDQPEQGSDWVDVPALPLDALELEEVRLIKLDVEGHEPQVLRGAWRTIRRWHPLIVLEDWHGPRATALPAGYQLAAEWEEAHQTYLYAWGGLG